MTTKRQPASKTKPAVAAKTPVASAVSGAVIKAPQIEMKPIEWFKPYKQNPRDNKDAVSSVAESIKSFGFLVPIVADSAGEIAAGHTRHLAAKQLKMKECPVIIADHLTPQQLQAFRLIDNKVSELAVWDYDLLAGEIASLQEAGVELTPYGWTQEELDCLSQMVTDDCLGPIDMTEVEADGVNKAIRDNRIGSAVISEHSSSVRVNVGNYNFFIPKNLFEAWSAQKRKDFDYNNEAVINWIAERLGLVDAHAEHQRLTKERRAAASKASAETKVQQEQAAAKAKQPARVTVAAGRRQIVSSRRNKA